MDLNNLVPQENTVTIPLVFKGEVVKNDDGSDMTVTVYGPWTKQYRSSGFDLASKRLRENKGEELTFDQFEESSVELLAKVTADWNITYGGEKPEFTVEKAKEVYSHIFWIKPLLEQEINKAGDFLNL
jgi:hypothetical protein